MLAAVITERIDGRFGVKVALPVLVIIGLLSAIYWKLSEQTGAGDLRPYILVQFLPMVLIPLMMWLFPKQGLFTWKVIGWVLAFYCLAKVLEHFDAAVFEMTQGLIAGHAPKHVAAACAPLALAIHIKRAKPLPV